MIVPSLVIAAALSLGRAEPFSILARSGVTATGTMRVTGNVSAPASGVSPLVGHVVAGSDALKDVAKAWDELSVPPCTPVSSLSGTIAPGVYCASSVDTTLAFDGSADSVWIIRIDSLTTLPDSTMRMLHGVDSSRVFWQVNGSAILGERSTFAGNLVAQSSIKLHEGVTVSGRLIAREGAVTLVTDDINLCGPTICESSLPNGVEKVSYNAKVIADCGVAPYVFSVFAGALPPDLELDPGGTLAGTPAAAGSFSFIVIAIDYTGYSRIRTYTVVICPAITLQPATVPDATVGYAYSVPISADGLHRFTATELPDGLALTTECCDTHTLLCGTPKREGNYTFIVTATDCDGQCTASHEYSMKVSCPLIAVFPETLDRGTVGVAYQRVITANGALEPYRFEATSIPPGATITTAGILSVPTTKQGDYAVTIAATNGYGCRSQPRSYAIHIACPPIVISPATLPPAEINKPYSVQLSAAPLPGPYQFAAAGLPAELTLSDSGLLSGTPANCGDFTFVVTATDVTSDCTGMTTYTLHVACCPPITFSPATLPHGTIFVPYNRTITISDELPYTTTVTGSVPLGLSAPPMISGIPMATGVFHFTITVDDGCSVAKKDYTIVIDAPPPPGTPIPTLSVGMLLLLAMVLAAGGVLLIRREMS